MAVTEILGTDSLSSSRITLNDNFVELQDRIDDISTYLDTTAQTLTGVSISATQITVSGTAGFLSVETDELTVLASTDMQGGVKRTGVTGSMSNGVTSILEPYTSNIYFVDGTSGPMALPTSQSTTHGTEILLIAANAGTHTFDSSNIAGISTAEFTGQGQIVELRAIDSGNGSIWWYVVGGGANFS